MIFMICPECGAQVTLPHIAVRLGGTLRCSNNHSFEYPVRDYYIMRGPDKGLLKPQWKTQ